jgi:hypothetical protein
MRINAAQLCGSHVDRLKQRLTGRPAPAIVGFAPFGAFPGTSEQKLRGTLMRYSFAVFLLAAIAALVSSQLVLASTVTFTAPTITVPESATAQTYTADVMISDTVKTDILEGYQLDLFISSTPGNFNPVYNAEGFIIPPPNLLETNVIFTGLDLNTASASSGPSAQYVYNNSNPGNSNNSNDIDYGLGNYLTNYTNPVADPGSPSEMYNGDTWANVEGVALLNQTWGLTQIEITVAAGFVGTEYLVWNANNPSSDSFAPFYFLAPPSFPVAVLSPNLVAGSITVVGPEPGSVVLMLLGAIGLLGISWRRRRSS